MQRSGPPGIFIVLSGLVRVDVVRSGVSETHFVGVGGSVGFVSSLLGHEVPGVGMVTAYAQVGRLRAPVCFICVTVSVVVTMCASCITVCSVMTKLFCGLIAAPASPAFSVSFSLHPCGPLYLLAPPHC